MTEKTIRFGEFEFPVLKGFKYLINEGVPETDFLLVNDPADSFSMTFEKDFPVFAVPENSDSEYCLFEMKKSDRHIRFFCPEKRKNLDTAVWYFYMSVTDSEGREHILPGQVRVVFDGEVVRRSKGKLKFIEILETARLNERITKQT